MLRKTEKCLLAFLSILLLVSCSESLKKEIAASEVFDEADRPEFIKDTAGDFHLCKPWNYDKACNADKKYPLFVYLHGGGGSGLPSSLPCFTKDNDKKTYPCFVYVPHAPGRWNNTLLIQQIERLKTLYRIDRNRIYLMGYSMGGSGSYALANRYYDHNSHLFAGIVRMAGQSQTIVRNAIADKTSIWYHLGLSDAPRRIQVAEDAYQFLKVYPGHSSARETSKPFPNQSHPGTTLTLTMNTIEIVKFTRYDPPVGHNISHIPLTDPYLLEWLFNQSLENR